MGAKATGLDSTDFLPERPPKLPQSPHFAAKQEGVRIELDELQLPSVRPLIVEGAGGVLVPLNEKEVMIDLMSHLALPVSSSVRAYPWHNQSHFIDDFAIEAPPNSDRWSGFKWNDKIPHKKKRSNTLVKLRWEK